MSDGIYDICEVRPATIRAQPAPMTTFEHSDAHTAPGSVLRAKPYRRPSIRPDIPNSRGRGHARKHCDVKRRDPMASSSGDTSGKRVSGSDKVVSPDHAGGDQIWKALQWGGGSKGSKGPITHADKRNQNSSTKG